MREKSETKLEPCPFCGGEAYVDSAVIFFNLPKSLRWRAECSACHARTAEKGSREEAVRAWNRRTREQSGGV